MDSRVIFVSLSIALAIFTPVESASQNELTADYQGKVIEVAPLPGQEVTVQCPAATGSVPNDIKASTCSGLQKCTNSSIVSWNIVFPSLQKSVEVVNSSGGSCIDSPCKFLIPADALNAKETPTNLYCEKGSTYSLLVIKWPAKSSTTSTTSSSYYSGILASFLIMGVAIVSA